MNNINSSKFLDKETIISLLEKLDQRVEEPYDIIICGGAAAITKYNVERYTDDIDFFEVSPESMSFRNLISDVLADNNFELETINSGARAYIDYLSPNYRNRLIPSDVEFKNLRVSFISKADLVSMKICALREIDIHDVNVLGIMDEDLSIINENLTYLAERDPAQVQIMRALFVKREETQKITGMEPFVEILEQLFEKVGEKNVFDEIEALADAIQAGQELVNHRLVGHDDSQTEVDPRR
jgi:hypothetical protein